MNLGGYVAEIATEAHTAKHPRSESGVQSWSTRALDATKRRLDSALFAPSGGQRKRCAS